MVFGGAAGFPATLDLGTLDGTNGFSITGAATSDLFGRSIDYGDFNGDGLDDLIVGADPSDTATEGSFVIFGSTASFASTFSVSALDLTAGFEILGPSLAVADDLGFLVSSAGDFNGDGIEDFAISAPYVTPASGVTQAGSTFIVFGTTASPGASLSVNALTGSNGIELNGDTFVDVLGVALANIGDINGDGIDDFAAGPSAN